MTPNVLETLILNNKPKVLVNALISVPHKERCVLSKPLFRFITQIKRSKAAQNSSNTLISAIKANKDLFFHLRGVIVLASFAIFSQEKLKRFTIPIDETISFDLETIFEHRTSAFIDQWLDFDLKRQKPITPFDLIIRLTQKGACRQPGHAGWVRHMVTSLRDTASRFNGSPIHRKLTQHPELIQHIPRLFEVKNTAFYPEYQKSSRYKDWSESLFLLTKKGVISREMLLNASVTALNREFSTMQLIGICQLNRLLTPSIEEVRLLEKKHLILLNHSNDYIVNFALKQLLFLAESSALDQKRFFMEVSVVFLQSTQKNAAIAIHILNVLIGSSKLSSDMVAVLSTALNHPDSKIRNRCAQILIDKKDQLDDEGLNALRHHIDDILYSTKFKLNALLMDHPFTPYPLNPSRTEPLRTDGRLAALPFSTKERYGIQHISMEKGQWKILPIRPHRVEPDREKQYAPSPPVKGVKSLNEKITPKDPLNAVWDKGIGLLNSPELPVESMMEETFNSDIRKLNSIINGNFFKKRLKRGRVLEMLLQRLFNQKSPYSEFSHLLLAFGLISRSKVEQTLAIDILIEGIESGSLSSICFSRILIQLVENGRMKLTRLGNALQLCINVSLVHAHFIDEILQLFTAGLSEKPHHLHLILEILLENRFQLQTPIEQKTTKTLEHLSLTGKALKISRELQSLQFPDNGIYQNTIHTIIRHRLTCAEKFAPVKNSGKKGVTHATGNGIYL